MKKKLLLLGLATAVFLGTSSVAMAATPTVDDTTTVRLSGGTLSIEETGSAFENMYPGDTRIQEIVLVNSGTEEVNFFMQSSGEDMTASNIGARAVLRGAAYTLDVTAADDKIYTGSAGGVEDESGTISEELSALTLENLQSDDGVLVANLKAGQSRSLYVQLTVDGESMGNDYQDAIGALDFDFWAQVVSNDPGKRYVTEYRSIPGKVTVVKTVRTIVLSAQTGDPAAIGILTAVMAACMTIIVLCIVAFKKRRAGVEK